MAFTDASWFQKAAAATGNGTPKDVDGLAYATIEVVITGTATVTFEGAGPLTAIDGTLSAQGGAGYVAVQATNLSTGTAATTATASGIYRIDVRGLNYIRARVSSWTSGIVTAYGYLVDR